MSRIAVVTGAGSGIGAAIAAQLGSRGNKVIVTDLVLDEAERVAASIPGSAALVLDVTDPDQCGRVAENVVDEHGSLDVWISNAGVSKMTRFLEISEEDFDRTVGVNLRGVFFASQAAARQMVKLKSSGAIVNVASMAGKQGKVPFLADYVASKFGVIGLTQAMAFELATHKIRVNSVCPGYVATPMQHREIAWEAELRGTTTESVRASWVADTPLGRLEQPEDVAKVVGFLTDTDAEFITGEAVAVNGGAYMD